MKVKIAKHAGFCMGVDLALKKLDLAISNKQENKRVVTIGPIIHNPQVLKDYQEKGVEILNSVEEIQKDMIVIIRAHGIPKKDEKIARENAFEVIDSTCPKVKTAQIAVEKATLKASKDTMLLLYGEEAHPEVQGILSYSSLPYLVFAQAKEIFSKIQSLPKNFIIASQTTQDDEIFNNFTNNLQKELQNKGAITVLNTICNATRERQEAVRELANTVDCFIVIGGKTSGNTRRLYEIASSYNIPTYHIETVSELKDKKFENNLTFALSAGASTPKRYLEEVKNFLEVYKTS